MMVEDLITNGSLIISFLFIAGQLFKNKPLNPAASLSLKLLAGMIGGVWGTVLMWFAIQVTETAIVDLRTIALVITTIYGGPIASVIFVVIFGFFRALLHGFNNTFIIALIVLILASISCSLIKKIPKWSFQKKYWYMILFNLGLYSISIVLVIEDPVKRMSILFYYWLISLCTAYFSYQVAIYITKSNELFRKYQEESKKDYITGLYNVRSFDEMFNKQIKTIENQNEVLSVLLIDIDYFKNVNDTYGHFTGDLVLNRLGTIFKKTVRSFDIVARKGGEEFSILLLDCPLERAIEIAEKIRQTVEKTKFSISNGKEISITISIGVATYPVTVKNHHDLLHQADMELYNAKRSGRNKVSFKNS